MLGIQTHIRLLPAFRKIRRRHTCREIKLNGIDIVTVTKICTHDGRGPKARQVLKVTQFVLPWVRLATERMLLNPERVAMFAKFKPTTR